MTRLFQDRDLVSAAVVDESRQAARPHHRRRRGRRHHARKPRTKSCPRPGLRDEEDVFAGVIPLDAPPPGVARHQPGDRVPGRGGGQPLRGHHRESGRAGRAHAHRRQHGRHRRHADRHADHPRHRARPGRVGQRALAAVEGNRASAVSTASSGRVVVGARHHRLVRHLEDRRHHRGRHADQPAGRGDGRRASCR